MASHIRTGLHLASERTAELVREQQVNKGSVVITPEDSIDLGILEITDVANQPFLVAPLTITVSAPGVQLASVVLTPMPADPLLLPYVVNDT